MSVPMVLNDVVTMRLNSTDGVSQIFNVLHYRVVQITSSSPGPPPTNVDPLTFLPKLAQVLYQTIQDTWSDCSSAGMKFTGVTAQDLFPSPASAQYSYTDPVGTLGAVAGDMLPTQDCVTILKKTGYGTRWGLGRYFHSGIPESVQQKGVITDAYRGDVQAYADKLALSVSVTIAGVQVVMQPNLWSFRGVPFPVRDTLIGTWVVSDNVIKTQRRRRPGKGI